MQHILVRPMGVGVQLTCAYCGASIICGAEWQKQKFVAHHAHCTGAQPGYYGFGDAVAAMAQPVARAVGFDPNCSACKQRRGWLNRLFPRLWPR
jgi:hypothetical protein